jgi:hypothetical protein
MREYLAPQCHASKQGLRMRMRDGSSDRAVKLAGGGPNKIGIPVSSSGLRACSAWGLIAPTAAEIKSDAAPSRAAIRLARTSGHPRVR